MLIIALQLKNRALYDKARRACAELELMMVE